MNRLDWCNPGEEWRYLLMTLDSVYGVYGHWRLSFTIGKVWNVSATHSFNSTCSVPITKCLLTQAIVCTNTNIKKSSYIWLHKYKYKIQKNILADRSRSYDQWRNNWLQLPPADNELNFCSMFCHSAVLPMIYAQRSNWGQLYWSGIVPRLKRW